MNWCFYTQAAILLLYWFFSWMLRELVPLSLFEISSTHFCTSGSRSKRAMRRCYRRKNFHWQSSTWLKELSFHFLPKSILHFIMFAILQAKNAIYQCRQKFFGARMAFKLFDKATSKRAKMRQRLQKALNSLPNWESRGYEEAWTAQDKVELFDTYFILVKENFILVKENDFVFFVSSGNQVYGNLKLSSVYKILRTSYTIRMQPKV